MAKILIIAGLTESLIRFRGELLTTLIAQGHQVYALAGDENASAAHRLREMGIIYQQISFPRAGISPIADSGYFGKLLRTMRAIKPDVLLCYTIKPVVYGMLAGVFARVPRRYALITGLGYAFIERPSLRWKLVNWLARGLYTIGLSGADGVLFQNQDDYQFFKAKKLISTRKKASVIAGSGVNTEHFKQTKLPDAPVFLLVARLLHDKGIVEYVEAAREVLKNNPDAIFYLVGPTDSNPAAITHDVLQSWIDDGVIHYVGPVDDVREWINKASVFVLPSYREGTPRSVLEAMAMGRPIITTDAPGCRDTVIPGDNGFLVPIKDPHSLSQAMIQLANDGELRAAMGERSRQIACHKYDVHQVNHSILTTMHLVEDNNEAII